jgi:hypothetical protein
MHWSTKEANINVVLENRGMTLRDYFAAKAMQAILQANKGIYFTPPDTDLSASAYEMADAMLKARQA